MDNHTVQGTNEAPYLTEEEAKIAVELLKGFIEKTRNGNPTNEPLIPPISPGLAEILLRFSEHVIAKPGFTR